LRKESATDRFEFPLELLVHSMANDIEESKVTTSLPDPGRDLPSTGQPGNEGADVDDR
jgi:hypothetical protein